MYAGTPALAAARAFPCGSPSRPISTASTGLSRMRHRHRADGLGDVGRAHAERRREDRHRGVDVRDRRESRRAPRVARRQSPTRSCRAGCGSTPRRERAGASRATVSGCELHEIEPVLLERVGGEDARTARIGDARRCGATRGGAPQHRERHRHVEQLLDRAGAQHPRLREQRLDGTVARRERAGVRRRRPRADGRAPRLHAR